MEASSNRTRTERSASLSSCFPCSYALCRATNRAMSNRIDFRDQRFSALTDPEHQQKCFVVVNFFVNALVSKESVTK